MCIVFGFLTADILTLKYRIVRVTACNCSDGESLEKVVLHCRKQRVFDGLLEITKARKYLQLQGLPG